MTWMIDLAGVGGAVLVSLALALGLEWLSLRGLMLLMPTKTAPVAVAAAAADRPKLQARRKAA